MITVARRTARPVSLLILMLFALGPVSAWAGSQRGTDTAPAKLPTDFSWAAAADLGPGPVLRPAHQSPRWLDASASASTPTQTGSWWSRRTTAQKTWFIIGMVVGAYGIYAIASNGSDGGSSGGGGY